MLVTSSDKASAMYFMVDPLRNIKAPRFAAPKNNHRILTTLPIEFVHSETAAAGPAGHADDRLHSTRTLWLLICFFGQTHLTRSSVALPEP